MNDFTGGLTKAAQYISAYHTEATDHNKRGNLEETRDGVGWTTLCLSTRLAAEEAGTLSVENALWFSTPQGPSSCKHTNHYRLNPPQ